MLLDRVFNRWVVLFSSHFVIGYGFGHLVIDGLVFNLLSECLLVIRTGNTARRWVHLPLVLIRISCNFSFRFLINCFLVLRTRHHWWLHSHCVNMVLAILLRWHSFRWVYLKLIHTNVLGYDGAVLPLGFLDVFEWGWGVAYVSWFCQLDRMLT